MNLRKELEGSPLGFKLCGSQYLGTADADSDWDYVVTSSGAVFAFLEDVLGMQRMGKNKNKKDLKDVWRPGRVRRMRGYYAGKYVRAIYELQCPETGVCVQVAVVADSSYKMRVMDVLKKHKVLRDFDFSLRGKAARNELFDAMYELAGFTEEPDAPAQPEEQPTLTSLLADDDWMF